VVFVSRDFPKSLYILGFKRTYRRFRKINEIQSALAQVMEGCISFTGPFRNFHGPCVRIVVTSPELK
jgi:hypothetical protein